ncbi:MAG: hypothetical protein ACK55I_06405, partial [bacterium]
LALERDLGRDLARPGLLEVVLADRAPLLERLRRLVAHRHGLVPHRRARDRTVRPHGRARERRGHVQSAALVDCRNHRIALFAGIHDDVGHRRADASIVLLVRRGCFVVAFDGL